MKYKSKFEKGWKFYLDHADLFTFCGQLPTEFEYDPDGPCAKEVFYNWEAGKGLTPTSEPELLQRVHNCKSSINFQIKAWVEGFADMMEPVDFYLDSFNNPPKWIRKALVNALIRKWGPNAPNWYLY